MEITYLGHSSFRLRGKNCSVVMDPFDPDILKIRLSKASAEIVTISHKHKDHSRSDLVSDVKKVIDGPGEYEISGVSFIGIPSYHDDKKGALRGKNTIFVVEMDGLRIAHLGDLGQTLTDQELSAVGSIDILMVPVGGTYTIGPAEAAQTVRDIEPKIILPMHFKMDGVVSETNSVLEKVDPFLSALGLRVEKLPKLVVKEGSLTEGEELVVLLEKR